MFLSRRIRRALPRWGSDSNRAHVLILLWLRRLRSAKPGQLGSSGATPVPRLGDHERNNMLAGDGLGKPGSRGERTSSSSVIPTELSL